MSISDVNMMWLSQINWHLIWEKSTNAFPIELAVDQTSLASLLFYQQTYPMAHLEVHSKH